MSFAFRTVPSLICQLGAASSKTKCMLGNIFKTELNCSSILLVTDEHINKIGLLEHAIENIQDAGINVKVFDKVTGDPPESIVIEALKQAEGIDGVLGFGGGSSLDVSKVVAFLKGDSSQELNDIYGVDNCVGKRLPLVLVPTTAGTGSEVTPISILTTGENEKAGIVAHQLYPDVALLDGNLTLTIPPETTAFTGIDAMVHALEARTSKFKKNPLSNVYAHEALSLLGKNIKTVCEDGGNSQARSEMLLGSCYAGVAFANSPVAAVHALAYPLGTHFKVPHGLSNSLMLSHVIRFNADGSNSAAHEYSEAAKIIFGQSALGWPSELHGAHYLADSFELLSEELNLPLKLSEVGVTENDIEALTSAAAKQERLLPNNPVPVSIDDIRELYLKAL